MIEVHSISKEVKLEYEKKMKLIVPRFCVTVVFTGFLSTLNIYNLPTGVLGVAKPLKTMTFLAKNMNLSMIERLEPDNQKNTPRNGKGWINGSDS